MSKNGLGNYLKKIIDHFFPCQHINPLSIFLITLLTFITVIEIFINCTIV